MAPPVPMRFQTARIVFSLSAAVVWGLILFWIGSQVAAQFHQDGIVARSAVLVTIAVTALVAVLLAMQNALVNLEHQWVHGRFAYDPASADPRSPRNVWRAAFSASLLSGAVWLPFWLILVGLVARQGLPAGRTRLLIGSLGFIEVALAVYLFAPPELRRRVGAVASAPIAVGRYLLLQYALPWSLVNGILGGVLAWLSSPAHRDPSVHQLPQSQVAVELAISTFLISVFMGLVTLPQAEVDVARGRVVVDRRLAPMPRLWLRYSYAALAAITVWLLWTLFAEVSGLPAISLPASFAVKTVVGGIVGAGTAWRCAAWSTARAASQVATPPR